CFAAWALWFLGQPNQALDQIHEALILARELSEPHGLAHALFFAAILHQLRRESRMRQEYAEAALSVSNEPGLVLYQAMATLMRAWALIDQEVKEDAIEQMRQGLAAHRATGAEVLCPHFLVLLAEALEKADQLEDALRVVEEAQELAHRNREGCYLAEIYRIRGELLIAQSRSRGLSRAAAAGKALIEPERSAATQAEGCFNQSIQIAQHQKAKSLELRAVMSLARLYLDRGKSDEAQTLLAKIYRAFTEGFSTRDLREAKALLNELS